MAILMVKLLLLLLLLLWIISLLILFVLLWWVLLVLLLLGLVLLYLAASVGVAELLLIAVEAVEVGVESVVLATFFASHVVVWASVGVAAHVVHLLVAHGAAAALLTLRVAHLPLTPLTQMHALMTSLRRSIRRVAAAASVLILLLLIV